MSNAQSFVLFGYTSSKDAVLEVKTLIHPQTGRQCNFIYDKGQFLEIHKMDAYPSSWFVNDQIIQDGSITLATPIHPLFLCIPFLQRVSSPMFMQLEDMFVSRDYPDVACLVRNSTVNNTIHLICEEKRSGEDRFYQFSKSKCIEWLRSRVTLIEEVLRKEWKAKEEEVHLEAIRMIGRYVDDALFSELCSALQIQRSDLVEVELPKAQPEKRQESKQPKGKRAKLEKSAKGMKTMNCFFKSK
ncbi:ribonuclease H2 subunit B [Blastocystis sp. ATCC 50177/Nand II]|uniref:Ribonuclease H2 subunit B n=1 Tax=Blastocystis sp. subtype 1 (strain ATCC 50177 / NandII) TaxID=478820 RepID=A0A196SHH3_BLAHN|nr:ribonuclease H2 subunit B [Blastocystis sp. ATCC 50177/Nand II]